MPPSEARSTAPSRASSTGRSATSLGSKQTSGSTTAGRSTSQTHTSTSSTEYVVAVHEQRGVARQVGLAIYELELGRVRISQYADSATLVKTMHLFNSTRPSVLVVLPNTVASEQFGERARGEDSMLVRQVKDRFDDCQVCPIIRKNWNEEAGFEFLQRL